MPDDVGIPGEAPPFPGIFTGWDISLDELARQQYRRGQTTGQTAEQHERAFRIRNAAQAIQAAAKWLGDVPRQPWMQRKKFGKQGKLYTLGDIQRNVIRSNKAVNDAKAKAQREEIRRANTTRREQALILGSERGWRNRPGIVAGPLSRRSGFEPGNPVAEALTDIWLRRVLDADAARKRLSTATNRRGALATRSLSARSATNRRGSLADRPAAVRTAGRTTVRDAAPTSGTARELPTRRDSVESQASREARSVMERTRELPRSRTSTRSSTSTASNLLNRYVSRLTGMFQRPSLGRLAPRVAGRAPTSVRGQGVRSSSTAVLEQPGFSLGQRLTPFEGVGVGSRTQSGKCDCPKPKKEKRKEFACSNPLVSRSVSKDGIITIKRKLQCQPSKPSAA